MGIAESTGRFRALEQIADFERILARTPRNWGFHLGMDLSLEL